MSNKIEIIGTIGEDEKDMFNHLSENFTISPSLAKIPGFNTKLLKACEELNGVITFDYPAKTFSIIVEAENKSIEEEVTEEDSIIEEEDADDDLPPSVTETTVEDDDDEWDM